MSSSLMTINPETKFQSDTLRMPLKVLVYIILKLCMLLASWLSNLRPLLNLCIMSMPKHLSKMLFRSSLRLSDLTPCTVKILSLKSLLQRFGNSRRWLTNERPGVRTETWYRNFTAKHGATEVYLAAVVRLMDLGWTCRCDQRF